MLIAYISNEKKTTSNKSLSFIRDLKLEQHGIPIWSYLVCQTDFTFN